MRHIGRGSLKRSQQLIGQHPRPRNRLGIAQFVGNKAHVGLVGKHAVSLKRIQILAHLLPRAVCRNLRPSSRVQIQRGQHLERHIGQAA